MSPTLLQDMSIATGITRFRRPEDSAWDPRKGEKRRNDAYFVTTADIDTNCRLWRLRFDDISKDPEKGGTIEILLTGSEGHRMLDNVTIDRFGRIVMDEDPGNNSRVSKIWLYQIGTGELIQVAEHNRKFFDPTVMNNSSFMTQDEESSGIIDARHILGDGWFLLDVQVHKVSSDPELVEGGQLLAMFIDRGSVPAALMMKLNPKRRRMSSKSLSSFVRPWKRGCTSGPAFNFSHNRLVRS